LNATKIAAFATLLVITAAIVVMNSTSAQTNQPGYMIVEYEVTDSVAYQEYLRASAALRQSGLGGKFLVRGAKGVSLSGEPPRTTAVIQFASLADAVAFDRSPEYTALKANRDKAMNWRSFVVEGVSQ
jgi:uncharacterized protein (DUF1330 family)